ncbi:hypothetical protein [Aliiroseovarius sp.]|uniref:hypothetical protein n=1 Tax=Aliiroseovarius sp. TaxID=1872442 RepID=UPI003BAD86B2
MTRGRPLRRLARAGALALALSGALPLAATSEPMRLAPEEARAYATNLLRQGQISAARALALVLLEADPEDLSALLVLTDAELALGNPKAAASAARRAWAVADAPKERFLAAMGRATALAGQERYLAAQLWLRRASDLAPSPALERIVARRFKAVSAQNPLRLSFSGSITPSDNVNGGSSETTMTSAFFGPNFVGIIPQASQALAGWKFTAAAQADRRLSRGPNHQTTLTLRTEVTRLRFSDEVREALRDVDTDLPTLTSSELGTTNVELRLSHQWRIDGRAPVWRSSLALSHSWLGGDDHADTLFATFGVYLPEIGPGSLNLSLSAQARSRLDNDDYSAAIYSAHASYGLPMDSGRLTLSLGTREAFGRVDTQDYSSVLAGVHFDLGKPVFDSVKLGLGLDLEDRLYDASNHVPGRGPMSIQSVGLSADATLTGLSFLGFAPVVTLSHERNWSNVPLYTNTQTSFSLGVRSQF